MDDGVAHTAERRRQAGDGRQASVQRLPRQRPARGRGLRERHRRGRRRSVDEVGEHGEAADAVGEDVVEGDDQHGSRRGRGLSPPSCARAVGPQGAGRRRPRPRCSTARPRRPAPRTRRTTRGRRRRTRGHRPRSVGRSPVAWAPGAGVGGAPGTRSATAARSRAASSSVPPPSTSTAPTCIGAEPTSVASDTRSSELARSIASLLAAGSLPSDLVGTGPEPDGRSVPGLAGLEDLLEGGPVGRGEGRG